MDVKLQNEIAELRCLIEKQKTEIRILKNNIFNLSNSIHWNIYWKNAKGTYLGENSACSWYRKKHGVSQQIQNIVGLNDYHIYINQSAKQYRENDLIVISTQKPLIDEEILILPHGKDIPQLSIKTPIYNEKKKVAGVLGQTISLESKIMQNMKNFFTFPNTESPTSRLKFFINLSLLISNDMKQRKTEYQPLTIREKECAYYLLKGTTVKEISKLLNISIRTTETHLENMKNKLHCYSKSQLVKKLFYCCGDLFNI